MAVFTGDDGPNMPDRYTYEYRGTRLAYEYPTLSVRAFSDEEADKGNVMNTIEHIKLEEREDVVRRLLQEKLGLSIEKIAAVANVSISVVKEIMDELGIKS
jgi:hypothetical protein